MQRPFKIRKAGFTLLELMVAIGLFTVSVLIGSGALVGLFDANNKSQTTFSAIGNLNYAIESMIRDIRFADVYHCGSSGTLSQPNDICPSGDDSLAVTKSGVTTMYRKNGTRIEKSSNGLAGPFVSVTGGDVVLEYVHFYVAGSAPASSPSGTVGRDIQPYVVLVVKGYSGSKSSSRTNFDIQTLISQKKIDL